MKTSDFNFLLPQELIAQTPLADRAASRLMALDRRTGGISHYHFRDIYNLINEGDCIVLNDTRVIPARLIGERKNTRAKIEILLLKSRGKNIWEVLVKPGKKAKKGDEVVFGGGILTAYIEDVIEDGNRLIRFEYDGIFEELLDRLGEMPLPPYITEKLRDKDRYQTVYAKNDGSAAAPTAGLHFTGELLEALREKGVNIAAITLHVGLGTFRPVKADDISGHKMHSEYFSIEKEQADIINNAKANGKRVIAVGTTACRTLETCSDELSHITAKTGFTDIFIYPGYKFKIIDGLITNFHLPESTLMMLVSAFAGREAVLGAYNEAIKEKYRFFSFGDAMLFL